MTDAVLAVGAQEAGDGPPPARLGDRSVQDLAHLEEGFFDQGRFDGRFPDGSDLARAWRAGAAAFGP